MKDIVRIGYIGLGGRGRGVLEACVAEMKDVDVRAICDLNPAKLDMAENILKEKGRPAAACYTDYNELLRDPEIDAVMLMTGWNGRIQMAIDCLEAGKRVAIDVGCAYDITECWKLVEACERTGIPCMMLENSCYERREMMILKLAKEGFFGKIVQCAGGYLHYLTEIELFRKQKDGTWDTDHYRLPEYIHRNCENYPTHELGPIMKILNINRGNRMLSLRSFATKSRGLAAYARDHVPADNPYHDADFRQGDLITTVITCAGGEQIILTLDTTLPRPFYSRGFTVRGTKGMCVESAGHVCTYYTEDMEEGVFNNEAEFFEKYDHPLHKEYHTQTRGCHGGVDWLTTRSFVESVKRGIEPPIDVYDAAALLAIAPLSEASIANGGAAVEIPDFTKGKWFRREPEVPQKYSLSVIVEDPDTPIVP